MVYVGPTKNSPVIIARAVSLGEQAKDWLRSGKNQVQQIYKQIRMLCDESNRNPTPITFGVN